MIGWDDRGWCEARPGRLRPCRPCTRKGTGCGDDDPDRGPPQGLPLPEGRGRRRRRGRPLGGGGRDRGLPRPERRRQDDHDPDARHAPASDGRQRDGGRRRPAAPARRGPPPHRLRGPGRGERPDGQPADRSSCCRPGSSGPAGLRRVPPPTASSSASTSRRAPTARRARGREVSGAGSTWRSGSCTGRSWCSSTSPRPGSTPRAGPTSGTRSATCAGTARPSSSRRTTSRRPTRSCDRLAILDGGRIVAEGTPDELKRQIAGDVVTVVVDGEDGPDALKLLAAEPFVRDASLTDGEVRLFVERGETAHAGRAAPPRPRRARHALAVPPPSQPRRRVPAADRPVAARRRLKENPPMHTLRQSGRRSGRQYGRHRPTLGRDTWLTFQRALGQTIRNPVWVFVMMAQPLFYLVLFGPLLERVDGGRRLPRRRRLQRLRPRTAGAAGAVRHRLRRFLAGGRAALRGDRATAGDTDQPCRAAARPSRARPRGAPRPGPAAAWWSPSPSDSTSIRVVWRWPWSCSWPWAWPSRPSPTPWPWCCAARTPWRRC